MALNTSVSSHPYAGSSSSYYDALARFEMMSLEAKASNEARRDTITAIYDENIARYRPGGSFGEGFEAQLGRQKVQDVSKSEQRDISSGLYGLRDRGSEWESGIGAEARLRLSDLRMERLTQAQSGMAGFLERINEPYPDYGSLMAGAQAQGSSAGGQRPSYGGSPSKPSYPSSTPSPKSTPSVTYGGAAADSTGSIDAQLLEQGMRGRAVIQEKGGAATGVVSKSGGYSVEGTISGEFKTIEDVKKKYPGAIVTGKSAAGESIWGVPK